MPEMMACAEAEDSDTQAADPPVAGRAAPRLRHHGWPIYRDVDNPKCCHGPHKRDSNRTDPS
jgi:hypothetical protein